mmetsp:Transcript_51960/g.118538  ORF Transcript_51960/g.118538 Transcript_51960/m.118538 type:complete len:484 (+) Transcript_51960:81-1532(+)
MLRWPRAGFFFRSCASEAQEVPEMNFGDRTAVERLLSSADFQQKRLRPGEGSWVITSTLAEYPNAQRRVALRLRNYWKLKKKNNGTASTLLANCYRDMVGFKMPREQAFEVCEALAISREMDNPELLEKLDMSRPEASDEYDLAAVGADGQMTLSADGDDAQYVVPGTLQHVQARTTPRVLDVRVSMDGMKLSTDLAARSLFISGLPGHVSSDVIRASFLAHGSIQSVRIHSTPEWILEKDSQREQHVEREVSAVVEFECPTARRTAATDATRLFGVLIQEEDPEEEDEYYCEEEHKPRARYRACPIEAAELKRTLRITKIPPFCSPAELLQEVGKHLVPIGSRGVSCTLRLSNPAAFDEAAWTIVCADAHVSKVEPQDRDIFAVGDSPHDGQAVLRFNTFAEAKYAYDQLSHQFQVQSRHVHVTFSEKRQQHVADGSGGQYVELPLHENSAKYSPGDSPVDCYGIPVEVFSVIQGRPDVHER